MIDTPTTPMRRYDVEDKIRRRVLAQQLERQRKREEWLSGLACILIGAAVLIASITAPLWWPQ